MDKSKLPKMTKKSSEDPWTPEHEQSKLRDRAGTVWTDSEQVGAVRLIKKRKSWSDKKRHKKYTKMRSKDSFFAHSIDEGIDPITKKATTKTMFGDREKKKNEEREY